MFYLVGFLQDGIEDTEMFYILQMTCDHNCTAEGSCWDLLTVVVVKRSLCVGAACWLWFVCFVSLDGCRVTFPLYYTSDLIPWPPRVPIEIGQHPLIRLLEMSPLKWSIIVSSLSVFLGSLCMYKQFRCCASLSLHHNLGAVRLADSVCHSPPCPTFCVWVTRLQIKNHLSLIFCPFFFFLLLSGLQKKKMLPQVVITTAASTWARPAEPWLLRGRWTPSRNQITTWRWRPQMGRELSAPR